MLSSNNTLGVLCLDIALCALCACLEPFVVKKTQLGFLPQRAQREAAKDAKVE
jgi:hypothetical protein